MSSEITIYTDGAASGNPGPGGYGVVLISGRHRLEKSEGFRLTTNNRMELLAVITGLEALKIPGSSVTIYTDSKYVADSVEKGWVFQWETKGFKKKKNPDLWIRFLKVYRSHNVRFVWIKGHASISENELCDQLAVEASKKGNLPEDSGYKPEDDDVLLLQ
jgi:ribonuclease HI